MAEYAEYIDRNELKQEMYHEVFEKDSDMQKWDSGCWMRYRLFEKVLEKIPSKDVVKVVRCGNCRFLDERFTDSERGYCLSNDIVIKKDGYCSYGKQKLKTEDITIATAIAESKEREERLEGGTNG